MRLARATGEQLGWTVLMPQVHALALVAASVALLLMAITASGAVLIGVAVAVVLVVALLYWTRSACRHRVVKTIGVLCVCTIAIGLGPSTVQNVPGSYLLGSGLVLFLGMNRALFLALRDAEARADLRQAMDLPG